MRSDEIKVTLRVQYGDQIIETAKSGNSGNPRFAAQEIERLTIKNMEDVSKMVSAVNGDFRKIPDVV